MWQPLRPIRLPVGLSARLSAEWLPSQLPKATAELYKIAKRTREQAAKLASEETEEVRRTCSRNGPRFSLKGS